MKKKFLAIILATVMVMTFIPTMAAFAADGEGTFTQAVDGYYEIADAEDWYNFALVAKSDTSAKARLVADIDFTGVTDLSGYVIQNFAGILDGQGFTVKNIEISTNKAFAFFNTIKEGGIVRNLKFDNVSLTFTANYYEIALIALVNSGRIENISASDVTVNGYYASVYARYNYGTISNCDVSNIDLDAKYTSGGIACVNYDGAVIEYCDVTSGTVTLYNSDTSSDVYGGGIVGLVSIGSIINCSNGATVSVTGGRRVSAGGIAGCVSSPLASPASFIRCRNTGNVSTTDLNTGNGQDYAGGITGYNSSGYYNVEECYNTGNITALIGAAGICGYRPYGSTNVINNCWNSGTITTTDTATSNGAAGIAGRGNAIVKNCLNIGTVVTAAYGNPIVATGSGSQPGNSKLVNSFALDGCVESSVEGGTVSGSQYYGYDSNGDRISTGVSTTDLANGTVLTALNAGNTVPVWGQVEGGTHPILLANNDLLKTTVTIVGVTATDKTYDGTKNVGYTGSITVTPDYDVSKITATYSGTAADGTAYNSAEAPTNAGEYVVTFEIPASDLNYSGKLALSFKITKAAVTDVSTPAAQKANINTTLGNITLPGGWAWADSTTALSEIGTKGYTAYYALTDEQIANYNYESLEGFNATAKRIERTVEVSVTLKQITFDSCDDTQIPYGSAVTVSGVPMIGQTALAKDTDYTVDIYTVAADGKVAELLTSMPSATGKYLVVINVDNTIYGSADYEIVGGEPATIIGEAAASLAETYDCAYIIEITFVTIDVIYGPTAVGYTSQPIDARPTVKNGDTILTLGTDYTVTYYSVGENGVITEMLSSAPVDMGKYLYLITLVGSYSDSMYGIDGGVPTIVTGTTTLDDLANYRCVATLTIEAAGGGAVDLSALENAITALEGRLEGLEANFGTEGEVTKLRKELDALKDSVSKLDDTYTTEDELTAAIDGVNNTISALATRVKALEDTYATKAELDAKIAALKALVDSNTANVGELKQALADVELALGALDVTYVTHGELTDELADALAVVNAAINKLNNDIIPAIQDDVSENSDNIADLKNTVGNLTTTVNDIKTNLSKLSLEDGRLASLISTLDTSLSALSDSLDTLKARVDAAEVDIDKLEAELAVKYAELKALIDTNSGNIDAINDTLADINHILTTLATQTDMQAEIGILTSLIDGLTDRIEANEDNISANINSISSMQSTLRALQSAVASQNAALAQSISSLSSTLSVLETRVEQNKQDISALNTNLQKAVEDLNKAIADGDKALSDEISALETALDDALAVFDAANDDIKAELEGKIASAQNSLLEAIKTVQKNLDDAKSELDAAIANKADTDALNEKFDTLNEAIANAETAAKAYSNTQDAALKSELEGKISEAQTMLQSAINKVAKDLADAESELAAAIASGDAELRNRISSVGAYLNEVKAILEAADADNKAELIAKIEAAESTLDAAIKAVEKNLDDAKLALEKAISDGDKTNADALAQAITELTVAIDAAKTAAIAADGVLRTELTTKLESADAALNAAIDALADELDSIKQKTDELQTFVIFVYVISGVALCGSGAFVVWFFIDRNKRLI